MQSLKEAIAKLNLTTSTLDSAGQPASYTVPEYSCPICRGLGWVYKPIIETSDPEYGKAFPCSCSKQTFQERRRMALMKFCGLPDDADALTFSKFQIRPECQDAYTAVMGLIAGDTVFLTLVGEVNTGKTHLAVATCHEYIRLNIPAKYAFTPALLDELRATYDADSQDTYQSLFERYCAVPLLVLDDLYRQKPTAWGGEKLMALINSRYMARLSTIFTTNKSFDKINKLDPEQGEAITSRLQREQWCKVVVVDSDKKAW